MVVGCASEQAASDPAADQSLAAAALFTESDLGVGWSVQPSDPLADALAACVGAEALGAPNARVLTRRYATPGGASVIGSIEMWQSDGAANNSLAASTSDVFNLCLRTAYESAIVSSGLTQVDRRVIPDPAPQRGDGVVRNKTVFTVQNSSGARFELQADIVRVRRDRVVLTTIATGAESADATSEVQAGLDAMLNRSAL
jgi:hypothetical protein